MLVVVAACLVALLAGAIVLLVWHRRGKDRPLALALNNMSQGVVMFDASGRVVVCNKRYLDIYGLSPDVVKPGARLIDIVRHRHAQTASSSAIPGVLRWADMDIMRSGKDLSLVSELPDGRAVAVVNRAIPAASSGFERTRHHPRRAARGRAHC